MSNLSQEKRKEMLEYINKLKEIHKDDESIIALEKIETALTEKKYGLVWEEHEEEVDKKLVHNIPVFTEVEERKIIADENEGFNFLLEGDNLHSLKLLEKTHKGKIDVIYIDPPYNTGSKDFIYDDNYIGVDDGYRHSKWLSFMNERLKIAKELLSEKGYIFISINNCEYAQLKIIMDDLFGEKNYIGTITWESTTQPINAGNSKYQLQQMCEYILCYSKDYAKKELFILEILENSFSYPHIGKYGKCRFEIIEKSDSGQYKRDTMKFNILGYPPRNGKRWQIGEELARELENEGKLEIVNGIIKRAIYPEDEVDKLKLKPFWSHLTSKDVGTAENGKTEVNNILGKSVGFDTIKPIKLIKKILSHFNKNILVLDFFAGSGTTAQAVMELNKSDGGNRRFILCTDNENNICKEITYERLSRVIKGYEFSGKITDELKSYNLNISNLKKIDCIFQELEEIKSEKKDEYNKISYKSENGVLKIIGEKEILDKVEGIPHNLKYFKTDFTPKFTAEEDILSLRLLDHIKEMVELENMCEIDGENRVIILSDENLKQNIEEIKDGAYLYMPVYILLSNEIKNLIEKKKINLVKIPEYYFMDELREANEI